MLCELCHKNEAAGVLHRKGPDGEDEELYVCKQCLDGDKSQKARSGNVKPTIITADGSEPPAFVKNFLDAAVGLIEGVADGKMGKARKCRVCGSTWEKIKETKSMGCPDCWTMFGNELKEEFLSASYGPTHKGRMPEKSGDGKPSIAFLEKELRDAVSRQDYRKAARIRKQLDELSGNGPAGNGNGDEE